MRDADQGVRPTRRVHALVRPRRAARRRARSGSSRPRAAPRAPHRARATARVRGRLRAVRLVPRLYAAKASRVSTRRFSASSGAAEASTRTPHSTPAAGHVGWFARDDEHRGRHAAQRVATLALAREECGEKPACKRTVRGVICRRHRGPDGRACHHVRLDRVVVALHVACSATQSSPVNDAPVPFALTQPSCRMAGASSKACARRIAPGASAACAAHVEHSRAVARLPEGLRRNRADAGPSPRH